MSDQTNIARLLEEAWIKRRTGNYEETRRLVETAHEQCQDDDYNSLGRVFHIYMQIESDQNHLERALELCLKSLTYYTMTETPQKIAHSTRHVADLQHELGQYQESENNYQQALGIYESQPHTNPGDYANALRGMALNLEKRNKIQEAVVAWERVAELYGSINLQEGVDEAKHRLNLLTA